MMQEHEKQSAQTKTEEKHEREQPGIRELLAQGGSQTADQTSQAAGGDQNRGQGTPAGNVQRRQTIVIRMRTHTISLRSNEIVPAHHQSRRAGLVAGRGDTK